MKRLSSAIAFLVACGAAAGFAAHSPTACTSFHSAVSGQVLNGKSPDGRPAIVFEAQAFGDLEGPMQFLEVSGKSVLGTELRGSSRLETAEGVIETKDLILLVPAKAKGVTTWIGQHRIVGGDGRYHHASGWMESYGAIDDATSSFKLRLDGVVCVPTKSLPQIAPGFGE
jgi:hypothetical protein